MEGWEVLSEEVPEEGEGGAVAEGDEELVERAALGQEEGGRGGVLLLLLLLLNAIAAAVGHGAVAAGDG